MAKSNEVQFSDFTAGEKIRLAGLVALMAKRGLADDGTGRVLDDVKKRMARIEKKAARRKNGK